MIERFLIEHCSATLASIKAANLCNMTFSSKEELEDQISYWSACLEPKGMNMVRTTTSRDGTTSTTPLLNRQTAALSFSGAAIAVTGAPRSVFLSDNNAIRS